MPRPWPARAVPWLAFALCCGALPPFALHAALAAAAGSLFETAPFVLAAELGAGRRWANVLAVLGCGCSRGGMPGALSPAATALTWLAFGPAIAAARSCAALAVAVLAARAPRAARRNYAGPAAAAPARADVFAELAALAPAAFAAALAAQALAAPGWFAARDARAAPLLFAAGVAVGVLAPCATAAVAIAAALAHAAAPAAAGVLCSAGFFPPPRSGRGLADRRPAGFASALLAVALATLALRGASGLVTPRLRACIGAAAFVAAAGARRRTTGVSRAALLPGAMLAALAAGSPPPRYGADATMLGEAFAGARVDFTGVSTTAHGATTLERFVITCCRIDAAPQAVRLNAALAVADGKWVAASGTLLRMPDGSLTLQPTRWRAIAAPRDPFAYR